ncbi:helix-turn-helix domain-containing protein [Brevundimonas sp.]|uniref:winged helix-turn-helix transcriptional regulator n=1 Tax=Brevundimonas sp. TaxID=1871086 RepID=UPI00184C8679|nr:helix-turn-helix domain-containing protein [Brevundimonas sp.]MBA4806912.1 helix-turn-helix transcriptional regulator [Brevundimonas sp.]
MNPVPECGLDVSLSVMGGKWKPLILYHLRSGPRRFGDLKRLVAGISEKVLIQQLRDLVATGVLVRRDYQQVPPKVDYLLTPFGMSLVEALLPLCDWGSLHRARIEALEAPLEGHASKKLQGMSGPR